MTTTCPCDGGIIRYFWTNSRWRHQMETFSGYWPFVWGIHRSLFTTLYWACDYLSNLGLRLNHVNKRGSVHSCVYVSPDFRSPGPRLNIKERPSFLLRRPPEYKDISSPMIVHGHLTEIQRIKGISKGQRKGSQIHCLWRGIASAIQRFHRICDNYPWYSIILFILHVALTAWLIMA